MTSGTEANISRSNCIQITNELTSGVNAMFGSNVCITAILENNNSFLLLIKIFILHSGGGHAPTIGPKFFNFHAVFGNNFAIGNCRAIKQGMVIVNTWVFILRRYRWHIHAGSWSLVNCFAGSLDEALYRVLMNINECGCRPYGWLGLDGNRCIHVIPRHPPFFVKKRLCLHAKKLLLEIYHGP